MHECGKILNYYIHKKDEAQKIQSYKNKNWKPDSNRYVTQFILSRQYIFQYLEHFKLSASKIIPLLSA